MLSATDIDSQSLSFRIVTNPAKELSSDISAPNCVVNGGGANCAATVIYTSTADQNGSDGFTFIVNDGNLDSNVAFVSITVNLVNDGAVAARFLHNWQRHGAECGCTGTAWQR